MKRVLPLILTSAALAAAQTPTIYLIGDATVRSGHGPAAVNQWGWGEKLTDFVDSGKANLVNLAGGQSNRNFYDSAEWQKTRATIKPGDFLIIQFGHNDNLGDPAWATKASLPGTGAETADWNGATVHTYGWYLAQYIEAARAKGATPIVCSIVPRKEWKDGKIDRASSSFATWAADVAQTEGAPFVDLQEIVARQYDSLGPAAVDPLFADPHTHTSLAGAELNAASLIAGLKGLASDPVEPYLSAKAAQIAAYRP
jgi:lysophospholipase L1-like esterase